MKRPTRAVAYGFLIWWLWFAFVGISQVLPESVRSAPSFALLRLLILVVLVVIFAVDYLRRVQRSTAFEGLLVGLTWMALMIANDFGHFLTMKLPFDLGPYLFTSGSLYAFIPVITVALFAGLMTASPAATSRHGA
jgi:Na+/proline symporter